MDISWETVKDFVVHFGWVKGTLTILFWVFHAWIYLLYNYLIAIITLLAIFFTIGITIGMMMYSILSKSSPATDSLTFAPAPTGASLEFYVIVTPPLVMSLFMVFHLLLLKRRDRFFLGTPGQNAAKEQRENLSKP
ncbi:MAG: hypothetical protein ACREEM_15415 [Blastocatellia bacterium]